jgi:hypothetical protein
VEDGELTVRWRDPEEAEDAGEPAPGEPVGAAA